MWRGWVCPRGCLLVPGEWWTSGLGGACAHFPDQEADTHPPVNRQTSVKALPCLKVRLRAVIIKHPDVFSTSNTRKIMMCWSVFSALVIVVIYLSGCHPKCESNPCMNNGICIEWYSHYQCDCAYTPYRGWDCGRGNLRIKYRLCYRTQQ